jgi:arylsulfatase A-like enzyme
MSKYRFLICLGMILGFCLGYRVLASADSKSLQQLKPTVPVQFEAQPSMVTQPNIILIVVDALRADHVSAYGYDRPTTPHLDAWVAAEGARFADATTTASWTHPSNAAMVTGIRSFNLGLRWETTGTILPDDVHTLAEYLHDAGYYTAGFVHGVIGSSLGHAQGFDVYVDGWSTEPGRWDKVPAQQINTRAIAWLDETWIPTHQAEQPLFLFLYYFDPHTWFDPPAPYDTLYDATYTGTLTPEVFQHGKDVVSGQIVPTARDIEHLIALYDGEITYWDAQFEQLMQHLQSMQILDDALIVFTADHGEMFNEHGKWLHRSSLYEEVLRVPLLMRYTGVITPGLVITTPVHNMDLMPTILDLIGEPVPSGLDAISLRPLLSGETLPSRDLYHELNGITDPAHSAYWLAPRQDMRAIRSAEWKLIHQLGSIATDELYQLRSASLYEIDNLVTNYPEQTLTLRHRLLNTFGEVFTLTGQISDWYGTPFANVTLNSSAGISATTSLTGFYTLSGLPAGTYMLTPTLTGYAFFPATRMVNLPEDESPQDFTILAGPVAVDLIPGQSARLTYTDTQNLPTHLDFAASAIAQEARLELTPMLTASQHELVFAGRVFDIVAYLTGTLQTNLLYLNTPATVTIHYSARDVASISDVTQLMLYGWNGTRWQSLAEYCTPAPVAQIDPEARVFQITSCCVGRFGLFAPDSLRYIYLPLVLRR